MTDWLMDLKSFFLEPKPVFFRVESFLVGSPVWGETGSGGTGLDTVLTTGGGSLNARWLEAVGWCTWKIKTREILAASNSAHFWSHFAWIAECWVYFNFSWYHSRSKNPLVHWVGHSKYGKKNPLVQVVAKQQNCNHILPNGHTLCQGKVSPKKGYKLFIGTSI